jgi:hypothetical protein
MAFRSFGFRRQRMYKKGVSKRRPLGSMSANVRRYPSTTPLRRSYFRYQNRGTGFGNNRKYLSTVRGSTPKNQTQLVTDSVGFDCWSRS